MLDAYGTTDKYRLIGHCRLCNSSNLEHFVDFGDIPLGNNLADPHKDALLADRYPLSMNRCVACDHFQLAAAVSPETMYATNYTYLSGVGKVLYCIFRNMLPGFKSDVTFNQIR